MITQAQYDMVTVGSDVFGSDGEKVGRIAELYPGYLTVEKGFFFPSDYFIPRQAIQTVQGNEVYLNVTKDAALHSGWDQVPTNTQLLGTDWASTEDVVLDAAAAPGYGRSTLIDGEEQDEIHIPLAAEELTATVRPREAGSVHIEKRVISEDRVLEVPVTEEHIRVERRVIDRPVDAADTGTFEQIVVEVPLYEETVDVGKQARVAEEVVVTKEAVRHTERVKDTVRHEEVFIDDDQRVEDIRR
jgi:uncharacterized protein (TIGR02271 family)